MRLLAGLCIPVKRQISCSKLNLIRIGSFCRVFIFLSGLSVGCVAQETALTPPSQDFKWEPALRQSFAFLALEHAVRLSHEADTQAGLKGPFWRDYGRAVTSLHGWSDGDPFLINYVGHPFQGAVTGFIQVQNDPRFIREEFGSSSRYWQSRMRAFAWSAAYSTQFELGPISEASIGNVQALPGRGGVVDLVVTPIGGVALIVVEDALDRFVIKRFENSTSRQIPKILVRGFLNPNRAMANMLRGKVPWHRDTRPD